MKARVLGPDAPSVSAIGLGGMPLSLNERPSEETAFSVIHASLDAGITLIDTADVYCIDDDDIGHNERLIAKALKHWPGPLDPVIVATKGGLTRPQGRWETNGRPEHLHAACDRSLKTLGIERIDLYQLHAPDMNVPFDESVGALAELQQAGKIRWIGLSNVSVEEIKEAESAVTVVTVQNRLSPYFKEALGNGVLEYCEKEGIGFLAYSPVGGGRLNKRLVDNQPAVDIAQKHGASPHSVVIAWVLAQGTTVIPIPGARTAEHAVDSAGAASIELSGEDMHAIGNATFSIE
jgi:aryl-alcohol dehydrogenase-like predicted oxidoreductase